MYWFYPELLITALSITVQLNFVFNVTKYIRMTDIPTLKQKLEQQYIHFAFDPAAMLSNVRLNSFTKKYIKNILARITGYIEEHSKVKTMPSMLE